MSEEIKFEVPYGQLFAKTWGEDKEGCKRVLALHSWMDNAGSFDKLIPSLNYESGLYVVAIDLPAHGKSSQFLPGSSYTDLTFVTEIRRVLKHLGWLEPGRKFSILGHSYGGCLGIYYCSLFPDEVEDIVLLDYLKFSTTTLEGVQRMAAIACDKFIDTVPSESLVTPGGSMMTKPAKPDAGQVVVSKEDAITMVIDDRKKYTTLSHDEASCLMERSTSATDSAPNSVTYVKDLRLNCMINIRESWGLNMALVENIKCHVFCILAKDGIYVRDELFKDKIDDMQELLREKCESFHAQWIEADHYLHMNKSNATSEIINNYWKSPANYIPVAC